MERILVIGAGGQLGSELVIALRARYSQDQVIAADIRPLDAAMAPSVVLDAMDRTALESIQDEHKFTQIYHLAAILSAKGESDPAFAWNLNMNSLMNVLELGKRKEISRIFWPSSIAVFGNSTPRENTPQQCVMDPSTVYGISKLAGEMWCAYYFEKYGVDVRSIRYPGLVSYKVEPGGGTTDYAIAIFRGALNDKSYTSYLRKDSMLPMMYIDDAVRGTIELMEAPAADITVRTSYNLGATSFTPESISKEIREYVPEFELKIDTDFRQNIADSWPDSIDDSIARSDWNWNPRFKTKELVKEMMEGMKSLLNHQTV